MSHDNTSRRVFGVSHETIVRRILRTFDRATASDVESGSRWYDEAGDLATSLAHLAGSREHAAAVISALSPRTPWSRNVFAATALLTGSADEARDYGAMSANVDRAERVLKSDSPLDVLTGPKTNAFARNILGDDEAVTVDVWACRVADLDETALGRVGAYDAVAHAYRLAARRRGVSPATMQATTWIVARNGRSS